MCGRLFQKYFSIIYLKNMTNTLGEKCKKRSKLRKGRLRGFVLKMFHLGWLAGTHFGIFLKKMKYIAIRVLIGQMLA